MKKTLPKKLKNIHETNPFLEPKSNRKRLMSGQIQTTKSKLLIVDDEPLLEIEEVSLLPVEGKLSLLLSEEDPLEELSLSVEVSIN